MQLGRKIPIAIERYLLDGLILALLVLLYAPLVFHWVDGWLNKNISIQHEYFSHGLIGFPFAAYIVWTNRRQWQTLPSKNSPIGLFCLGLGAVFYLSNLLNLINLSLVIVLIGLCLWLKGWPGLRLQAFPLLLVFLATPTSMPYLLEPYTLPLQQFIASVAGFILHQMRVDVTVRDISLYVGDRIVEVAPYCAGLKMLFTSLYVALMLLYWRDDFVSRTRSMVFLGCTVLLSVVANILRNTLLTFFHGTNQDALFKWVHDSWGGDLYSACMLMLLIPILMGLERLIPEPTPLALSDPNASTLGDPSSIESHPE